MADNGDGSIGADFDMNLLSDLLFQEDGTPKLADDIGLQPNYLAVTTASTDVISSSDDAGASSESPYFAPVAELDKTMERKAKRRAQVAVSAKRHRYRKKHEMLELKREVGDLTKQLHVLRSKHQLLRPDGAVAEAEEFMMAQRHKRRQAEKVNEQLRVALVRQRQFFASIQAFVFGSAVTNATLNMSTLMHTYTRLGRTTYSRRRDYLALCSDSKSDLAIQILLRETEGMAFTGPPTMITHTVPAENSQQQVVTTVAGYAFDFLDLRTVFVSACDVILGCGTEWPQYTTVMKSGEVLDRPLGNISYAQTDTSYESIDVADPQNVSVESRSLVFYRMGDNYGLLVWDFADEDDLYPVKPETTIKRALVGAAMVRREMCHDGVERVVYRSICTKLHSFSVPAISPVVYNYLQKTEDGAKVCGQTVLKYIREQASHAGLIRV